MPKKQVGSSLHRDPIAHLGQFEEGDGDLMMRRTRRNFGPQDIDVPKKKVTHDNTDLLKKIFDKELKNTYGKKYAERIEEPSMYELLSGGFEAPVEHDYKKGFFERGDKPLAKKKLEETNIPEADNRQPKKALSLEDLVKKDIIHRINKSESQYVSETQDNFRNFAYDKTLHTFLYDYFQNPERNKGKAPAEIEDWMNTIYRQDYINRMKAMAAQQQQQEVVDLDREEVEDFDAAGDRDYEVENKPPLSKAKSSEKEAQKNKTKNGKNGKNENDKKGNGKTGAGGARRPFSGKDSKAKGRAQSASWKDTTLKRSSEANRQKRIEELHKWARWLPDSAYQSYFGKPAFHAYGKGNTKPTVGGHVYGHYLLSHNVNPEAGQNNPKYQQVYRSAMNHGFKHGDRVPQLSRKGHENLEITPSQLKELMKRNPIMPPKFKNPDPEDMYTEGSDNEYDFSQYKNKNKDKLDFHPKQNGNKQPRVQKVQDNEEEEPQDEEAYEVERGLNGAVGRPAPDDRTSQTATPEPGTLEYKRMLDQFVNNPEYVKMLMQEGGDLQNMFPFCSVHNSYGQQLPLHELDPRNYRFLPSKYVERIAPAGKKTLKSDNLYNVILPDE